MTIIQKIKHKLAVREAAKRRKLERLRKAVNDGWNAAQAEKIIGTRALKYTCKGVSIIHGLN